MTNLIISPAMLKTYEQSKKKFFLQYVRNIYMPKSETNFETGKNIHAIARYYLSGLDIKKFENSLSESELKLWKDLQNNEFFCKTPVKTEFQLNFKLKNLWFGGRIDAIVREENNYYILDYKTGNAPKDAKYDYQTMIYLLATDKYLENYDKLKFVYISLKNNENIIIDTTKELFEEYESKLTKAGEKLTTVTENNLPNKTDTCHCEYAKICF